MKTLTFTSWPVLMLCTLCAAGCPMDDDDDGTDPTGAHDDDPGPESTGDDPMTSDGDTSPEPATTGCHDTDDDSDDGTTASDDLPAQILGITGRAKSAMIAPGNDGVGTVFIAAFDSCELTAGLVGIAVLPNADLSVADVPIEFTIEDLPPGTVFLAAFLDDDGNADPTMPMVGPGDLVFADVVQDGQLSCVEVALLPGESTAAEIWLDSTVPL
ncbi:MAG: hypothetical protein K0V04_41445 [Deltaproteobacteria bacterium]|nr:hypothetical protein [Deltaproteobacteria bacterium]